MQSELFRNKAKKTCQTKYGKDNPMKVPEIMKKSNETRYKRMRELGKFDSRAEKKIYEKLITLFDKVEYGYTNALYPYRCDFYIPCLDLYIEYNGFWTHGGRPYNESDPMCQNILKVWKERGKDTGYHLKAIQTWTIYDVAKRETAKRNNLNWIEFFDMKEFDLWFISQTAKRIKE